MADSPLKNIDSLVTFKVLSNGRPVEDTYQVFKISVEYALNRIPAATLSIQDGNVAEKDFVVSDSNDFIPGTDIEIQAGYDNNNETIFQGIVVGMRLSLDAEVGSVLEVSCKDVAIRMTEARKNAYFVKQKDSDIISTLIGNYSGLSSDVDTTKVQHRELIQYDATDWDYMMMRADLNGLVTSINQGKVSIKAPAVSSSPVLSLTYGVDLMEFSADLNASVQTPSVKAVSWDISGQVVSTSDAATPSTPKIGNITGDKLASNLGVNKETLRSTGPVDPTFLQSWADARLQKVRLASLIGSAMFPGSSLVLPNTTIQLTGVGDRYSGTAFVSAVEHLIHEGQWTTEVKIGLEDEWFASKPNVNPMPASGLTPQFGGLMIGKVKKLDEDPDKLYRIQVTLPLMEDSSNAIWARLASYYASNSVGNFFIPEVGDEVILGFLNNDPNFPVVLGSLYSTKNTAPYDLTADNFTKAIVTKAKNKIEFDDDKKVITIQTPGKNVITLTDENKAVTIVDQNGNSFKTSSDGITIEDKNSNKIAMTGSGIEISSNSNIKVTSSGGDVSVSGNNITNSANMSMKSTGSASAEFSASGNTTIKGAMVMIN